MQNFKKNKIKILMKKFWIEEKKTILCGECVYMCNIDEVFSTKVKDILPPIARIIIMIINKNITITFLVFSPPFNYSNPGIKIILQIPTPYYYHPSIIRYSRVSK